MAGRIGPDSLKRRLDAAARLVAEGASDNAISKEVRIDRKTLRKKRSDPGFHALVEHYRRGETDPPKPPENIPFALLAVHFLDRAVHGDVVEPLLRLEPTQEIRAALLTIYGERATDLLIEGARAVPDPVVRPLGKRRSEILPEFEPFGLQEALDEVVRHG